MIFWIDTLWYIEFNRLLTQKRRLFSYARLSTQISINGVIRYKISNVVVFGRQAVFVNEFIIW